MSAIYVLGGHQTDFARNWSRAGLGLDALLRETARAALDDARLLDRPGQPPVDCAHVGNFIGQQTHGQGHLGALLVTVLPELAGIPVMRHEAACASGGIAALAALAQLRAGMAETALVVGVELMRADAGRAARQLGAAARVPQETEGVRYPWPSLFAELAEEYAHRYGLDDAHLRALGRQAFANARANPRAQTRGWTVPEEAFTEPTAENNGVVAGRLRRYDCSQITDGGAAVVLASERYASTWAVRHGLSLADLPRIAGWGHTSAPMEMRPRLEASRSQPLVLPNLQQAVKQAFARADVDSPVELDVIESHDCFTITQYAAIDHFGFTAPGRSFQAIEDGRVMNGGLCPINPSGGLIGVGHPVGASGVRMLWDVARQVSGGAAAQQVPGARTGAVLNIGGSAATAVCFVLRQG